MLAIAPAFAAVDGVIVNGTTGQPEPNTVVMLIQPTQAGMQTLGTTKTDAQGKFSFDNNDDSGPRLIQAIFQGVQYNKMVPPGMPSTGVQIPVFASTNKAGTAKETQHFIVLQPGEKEMTVSEGLLYVGDPNVTYYDPVNGSVRFYVPPEAKGPISVTVNPAGGMPIQRPALKTKEPEHLQDRLSGPARRNALRPELHGAHHQSHDLHRPATARRCGIESGGPERRHREERRSGTGWRRSRRRRPAFTASRTRASKWKWMARASSRAGQSEGSGDDNGQPQVQEVKPRIYESMYWILGMAFAILGLGSVLLARNAAK